MIGPKWVLQQTLDGPHCIANVGTYLADRPQPIPDD